MKGVKVIRNRTATAALLARLLKGSLAAAALVPHLASATAREEAEPSWVGAASVGFARGQSSLPLSIDLGAAPMGFTLSGQTRLERGSSSSFTWARQFRGYARDEGPSLYPVRLELEDFRAALIRRDLSAGIVQVALQDEWRVRGTFLNGLVRLADFDTVQWWLGAGIGRLRAEVPDASNALPGCGCLREGSASAWVPRLKLRAEWPTAERSALFVEAAQTRVPAVTAGSGQSPVTNYQGYTLRTTTLGWRVRF